MNNKLIQTNGVWYKIKNFFKRIFFRKKYVAYINETKATFEQQKSNNSVSTDNIKEKFTRENEKKALAEKLLYGELGTSELDETEVDEMTEYFTKDIQNIDNELLRIKQHILAMQKELKQN